MMNGLAGYPRHLYVFRAEGICNKWNKTDNLLVNILPLLSFFRGKLSNTKVTFYGTRRVFSDNRKSRISRNCIHFRIPQASQLHQLHLSSLRFALPNLFSLLFHVHKRVWSELSWFGIFLVRKFDPGVLLETDTPHQSRSQRKSCSYW